MLNKDNQSTELYSNIAYGGGGGGDGGSDVATNAGAGGGGYIGGRVGQALGGIFGGLFGAAAGAVAGGVIDNAVGNIDIQGPALGVQNRNDPRNAGFGPGGGQGIGGRTVDASGHIR